MLDKTTTFPRALSLFGDSYRSAEELKFRKIHVHLRN